MHSIWWFFGLTNGSGTPYLFWSGIGSDLGEFAIAAVLWHKMNCDVAGCWRLGLRKVAGTNHTVCHKHHPDGQVTAEELREMRQP